MPRQPGRYVVDGRGVLVPPRVASILLAELSQLQLDRHGRDREFDDVIRDFAYVAIAHRSSVSGTSSAPTAAPVRESSQTISTTTAAKRLGITGRGVRQAIQRGRIDAHQDAGGRWLIPVDTFENYQTARRAAAA